jgi:glutamate/tyrosine decarboxylase-like PLP-dependent enzyme
MDLKDLDLKAREILQRGKKIACVVGTLGTTDNFALDDLRGIFYLRNKWQAEFSLNYPISIHADAAIGWAWSFFKNYDFSTNPLQFPLETLQALQKILTRIKHLEKADTVSLNPHKYGYVPIPASFILFKQEDDALSSLRRGIKEAPQLGKTTIGRSTGSYTIETTRSPIGVLTTLANFLFLGIEGYQAILGRVVEMGLLLRRKLKQMKGVEVFNEHGLGGGTTFCFTCPAWTLEEQNLINETIFNRLSFQSVPVNLSLTRIGGKTAIKSLIITPFLESEDIDKLVSSIRAVAVDMNLS